MKGKEFKKIINEVVQDNDDLVIMDKHCGDDCLYILIEDYIRRVEDGDGHMVVISVRDNY